MNTELGVGEVRIVDLDTHEPTDDEILSWMTMMTAADQLAWEYDASWAEEPTEPEQAIDDFRKRRVKQRGRNHPLWAISDGQVVGMIGINRFDGPAQSHSGELGFGVSQRYRRLGIGTRLLSAAVEKARAIGLHRLEADCFDDNSASTALLQELGFKYEGLRVDAIAKDGQYRSIKVFGLIL